MLHVRLTGERGGENENINFVTKGERGVVQNRIVEPEEIDREVFKMEIEKARAIAYLVRTVSEIIAKNEMEDRIAALENAILQEAS